MGNEKIIEGEFKIEIDELFPKFQKHLEIENNKRILFSGKFGIGKTYFLNEFFKNKKEDYEVFHLFPVDYQITLNENIIEFLKYDILVELLKKNEDIFQKDDYSSMINLQRLAYLWGKDNFTEIFKTGISFIPKLGKPLKDTIGLAENFWEFKNKVEAGEKGFIDNFLKEIKEKNISETDSLSELLKQKIKKQKNGKQSVLILDDLERIDPEHIFRILNIFSAHFNSQKEELPNKFGFDKIILVADIRNLKSIFHYKYGEKTDFNGYLDKFFSIEVFEFKNEEIVAKVVEQIILKFKMEDTESLNKSSKIFLENILLESLELNGKEKLNLRQLLKGIKFPLFSSQNGSIMQWINSDIKALISIFGGMDSGFISVLKKIKSNIKNKKDDTRSYSVFSYYLLKVISPFEETEDSLQDEWGKYSIKIENERIKSVANTVGEEKVTMFDFFFDLLIEYVSREIYKKEVERS